MGIEDRDHIEDISQSVAAGVRESGTGTNRRLGPGAWHLAFSCGTMGSAKAKPKIVPHPVIKSSLHFVFVLFGSVLVQLREISSLQVRKSRPTHGKMRSYPWYIVQGKQKQNIQVDDILEPIKIQKYQRQAEVTEIITISLNLSKPLRQGPTDARVPWTL